MQTHMGVLERAFSLYDSLTSTRKRCLISAFIFTAIVFTMGNAAWLQRDVNDDFTISIALSGRLADPQGLCLFLNAMLCEAIYGLNVALPTFNWFVIIEETSAYLGFFALVYIALSRTTPQFSCLFIGCFTILAIPGSTFLDNFTYAAFIDSCAGGALLLASLKESRHTAGLLVAGVLLMLLGSLWRFEMFLLCIPAFGIACLAIALDEEHRAVGIGKSLLRLWPFIVVIVMSFSLFVVDRNIWGQSPWHEWNQFNDVRSELSDFPHRSYGEIDDELAKLGVSENDYRLLFSWITEDPDFFTIERLEAIADVAVINPLDSVDPMEAASGYAWKLLHDYRTLGLLIGTLAILLVTLNGRNRIIALGLLALAVILSVIFYAWGRLPTRVHHPIWLYSLTAIMLLAPWRLDAGAALQLRSRFVRFAGKAVDAVALALPVVAATLIIGVGVVYFTPERITTAFTVETFEPKSDLVAYIEDHPEKAFAYDYKSGQELKFSHYLRAVYSREVLSELIPLGGWNARAPYALSTNAANGMENPLRDLVENKDALYLCRSEKVSSAIITYIQEHYYPNAGYKLVDVIDGENTTVPIYVFRFTSGE